MRAVGGWVGLAGAAGLLLGWLLWGRPAPVQEPPVAPGIDSAAARADSLAGQVGALSDSLQTLAQRLAHASRPRPRVPLPPRPVTVDSLPAYADSLESRIRADSLRIATLEGELATAAVSVQALADTAKAAHGRLMGLASDLDTLAERSERMEKERDGLARRVRSLSRPVRVALAGQVAGSGDGSIAIAGLLLEGRKSVLFLEVRADVLGGYGVTDKGETGLAGAVRVSVGF